MPRIYTELVGVKLSKEQREFVEEQRGSLSPSQYLRLLVVRERRRVRRSQEVTHRIDMVEADTREG